MLYSKWETKRSTLKYIVKTLTSNNLPFYSQCPIRSLDLFSDCSVFLRDEEKGTYASLHTVAMTPGYRERPLSFPCPGHFRDGGSGSYSSVFGAESPRLQASTPTRAKGKSALLIIWSQFPYIITVTELTLLLKAAARVIAK